MMLLQNHDFRKIIGMFEKTIVNELEMIREKAKILSDNKIIDKVDKIMSIREKPYSISRRDIIFKKGKCYKGGKLLSKILKDQLLNSISRYCFIKDDFLHGEKFSMKVDNVITEIACLIDKDCFFREFISSDYDNEKYWEYVNDSVERVCFIEELIDVFDYLHMKLNNSKSRSMSIEDVFSCLSGIYIVAEYALGKGKIKAQKKIESFMGA
jgi:hypothetical protein